MWKLSLDVENEPPVKIEPPVKNEPFLRNVSMRFREQRMPFIISFKFKDSFLTGGFIFNRPLNFNGRLIFHIQTQFPHPGFLKT